MNQQLTTVTRVQQGLAQMHKQFKSTLPTHISPEKFLRACVTAVQNTPDLQQAEYESIISACQKAATDGLIIDNREAALVVFNAKQGSVWVKKAQYMPMVAGILKKARQSGQISTIYAHAVYSNEHFEYSIDEHGEHIKHIPMVTGNRGEFLLAYAGAVMKDGSTQVTVLPMEDIERSRKVSKSGADKETGDVIGIWKTWYPEMACKTALRKLCKFLPSSTDLDSLFANDPDNFNQHENNEPDAQSAQPVKPATTANEKLKQRAAAKQGETIDGTAERINDQPDGRPTPPPITDDELPI